MKDRKDNLLPFRRDVEDEIFIICMTGIKEFPQYVTKFNDIVGPYESRFISSDFKNLNLDSVRIRKDNSLINIEHHSTINENLMRRDYEYAVTLFRATGKKVHPYILYTGDLPIKKVQYMNEINYFYPEWILTKEKDASVMLNNIECKIYKQEELNAYDVLDLIWLPKFYSDLAMNEVIMEIIRIFNKINASEFLLEQLQSCLILWAGRYIKDKDENEEIERRLNMSALKRRPLEEALESALIDNYIEQKTEKIMAEGMEKGMEKGEELGRFKDISLLLKHMSALEISQMLELPLEEVLKVERSISN